MAMLDPPGPRFRTPFQVVEAFRSDTLGLLERTQREYGDVARFHAPLTRIYLLAHPDHVKHVLQTNHRNYWKGRVFQRLKRITGNGVLFAEGDFWQQQRGIAAPAFARAKVESFAGLMAGCAEALARRWLASAASDPEPIELGYEMGGLGVDVVTRALFGAPLEGLEEFRRGVDDAIEYANYLLMTLLPLPLWVPTARNRKARRTRAVLDATIDRILGERRRRGEEGDDLLGLLFAASRDPACRGLDEAQIRDELVTFINAGHETTAVALAWTWYLLSQHPEAEARLHAELDAALGGRVPEVEDLPRLPFTRRVIEESMRLYPPAWGFGRDAHAEDEIGGYRIEAKGAIFLSPWLMHRDPRFWDAPEAFDPDRFLPERSRGRPRYAYFPFGGGPRMCIGSHFAMLEMQLVLATLAQRVTLRLVPGHPVEPDPIFTLRPRHGIAMTVHPRGAAARSRPEAARPAPPRATRPPGPGVVGEGPSGGLLHR
jgi:cytochrome P450